MRRSIPIWLGRMCRTVAVAVIAGLWPGTDDDAVEARLRAMPARRQAAIVAAVLVALLAAAMVAAQFGPLGMAVFFAAVIFIAR
jgi:hypothetical protein